jgi:hypothetical protein
MNGIVTYHGLHCGMPRNVLAIIRNWDRAGRVVEYLKTLQSRARVSPFITGAGGQHETA